MSRRQLRKLQEGKSSTPEVQLEEEDDRIDDRQTKPRQSLFATLAALPDQDDEDEEEQDEVEDEQEHNAQLATQATKPVNEPVAAPSKKKKKKKTKKKKAANADGEAEAEAEAELKSIGKGKGKGKHTIRKDDGLDEIDRAVKELNLQAGLYPQTRADPTGSSLGATNSEAACEARLCELLKINPHHLRVANEMKAKFGKDTVAAADADEQATRSAAQRQGQQVQVNLEDYLKARPNQGLKEVSINRNYLIQGKKTWPIGTAGGLAMTLIRHEGSPPEFAFTHDKAYTSTEAQFFVRSNAYSPDLMVDFLHSNPYHISSLVIVSKIAKHQGDHALAGDLMERALFTFGRIMLSPFKQNLENGKARLVFKRPENRQFWLVGQQYLVSLMKKGAYRTALEWARLLLQLDPSDPYAIGQLVHVIAIKAKAFQWLLEFCETDVLHPIRGSHWGYPRQTAVLAKLRLGDEKGAVEMARAGMKQFPWLYSDLFKEFGMDIPKAIWGSEAPCPADVLYTKLYIHQAKDLWNFPKATDVLFEAAHGFEKPLETPMAKHVTLGVARMLFLDDRQDLMGLIPSHILHADPNYEFDPLPPPMEENIFSSDAQRGYFEAAGRQESRSGLGAVADEHPRGAIGAVLDFMRTRLGGIGGGAGGGVAGPALGQDLPEDLIAELVRMTAVEQAMEEDDGWPSPDDFYGYNDDDDEEEEEEEEEMPGLVAVDDGRPNLRATVEDAEESDDDEVPPLVDPRNRASGNR